MINTSKNIYKPCFNMPQRDTPKPAETKKKEGPPKRHDPAAGSVMAQQRAQSKGGGMQRQASKSKLERPVSKGSQFSKPALLKTQSSMRATASEIAPPSSTDVTSSAYEASQSEQEAVTEPVATSEAIQSVY